MNFDKRYGLAEKKITFKRGLWKKVEICEYSAWWCTFCGKFSLQYLLSQVCNLAWRNGIYIIFPRLRQASETKHLSNSDYTFKCFKWWKCFSNVNARKRWCWSLFEMYSALKVIQSSLITIDEFTNDLPKVKFSLSKRVGFICVNESPLTIMTNDFCFIWRALLWDTWSFVLTFLVMQDNGLMKKVNFKTHDVKKLEDKYFQ